MVAALAALPSAASMVQLDIDPFLNELNKLFNRNKDSGSLTITMKRSEPICLIQTSACTKHL